MPVPTRVATAKYISVQKDDSAIVEFVDIAGLVKEHRREGLGNKFPSHIREVDAIAEVVACLNKDIHVHEKEALFDIIKLST